MIWVFFQSNRLANSVSFRISASSVPKSPIFIINNLADSLPTKLLFTWLCFRRGHLHCRWADIRLLSIPFKFSGHKHVLFSSMKHDWRLDLWHFFLRWTSQPQPCHLHHTNVLLMSLVHYRFNLWVLWIVPAFSRADITLPPHTQSSSQ